MLRALTIIVVFVVALGAGLFAFAATRPDDFLIQRSAAIKAPPEKIFAIINDFSNWPSWSPWQHLDPAMKVTNSGPASGKGAVSQWDGNSKVGAGRTEITLSDPPSRITMALDMSRPVEAHNIVEYALQYKGDTTTVTWTMRGARPLLAKAVGLFIDCDAMVGKDFEAGLANLKALAEK